ncbi:hypothetical protein [Flammeovirga kamogawensis]|uniref:Porin family protein n=1 Tax=Flammeovirga kamogawensis TaxID=373891 RepID=A0ABX8H1H8_9BACT|nr:hypothetical protein [Flammeovirga kamogawensis]MBB6462565.1 hypothetical protein [Flammeovirga kamogawensis]QWG09686.1 hypothetical protein KM029_24085 [Flammeovirga kamogawensis]TRX65198.1 hypothetical protein EO216_21980 [Flammeovirga kamogawensis]
MKKILFLLFVLTSFGLQSNAQNSKRFITGKHPIGVTVGGAMWDQTQLKLSAYAFNVYFSYVSNLESSEGKLAEGQADVTSLGNSRQDNYQVGAMLRVVNTDLYGLYLIPQFVITNSNALYKTTNGDVIKDNNTVVDYGAGIDLMYVDRSGFTAQFGLASSSGVSIQVGYSF